MESKIDHFTPPFSKAEYDELAKSNIGEPICKNCIFNGGSYGRNAWEAGSNYVICTRFIPHISNTKIEGNANKEDIEIVVRKSEIQMHILKKEQKDLPYLLLHDTFGCNEFKIK